MKFYVARHGETQWNALSKICGRTDIDLTEKGENQAHELGKRMKAEGKIPDVMVVSPMRRAQATAKAVLSELDKKDIEFITDDRLIEMNYGTYEGKDRNLQGFLENKGNFAMKYPEGESQMMVAARVYTLIDELKEKYHGKTVMLVCHGGVCRVIHTYFHDMDNKEFLKWSATNCCLTEYETD